MKKINLILLLSLLFVNVSCEDSDDNPVSVNEINDFVWKGMNATYLYKSEIPALSDTRFNINGISNRYETTPEYISYLNGFSSPPELFESLLFDPSTVDRFSRITDNYIALLNQQQGIIQGKGLEFNLY